MIKSYPYFHFPVCVTIIYIPLMLFGLLGNILTILVVWLRPQMRSSTYLYLSSMAVSDLLILLLLPLDLYKVHAHTYRHKVHFCNVMRYKMHIVATLCSTLGLILFCTVVTAEIADVGMKRGAWCICFLLRIAVCTYSGLNKPLLSSPQGNPMLQNYVFSSYTQMLCHTLRGCVLTSFCYHFLWTTATDDLMIFKCG